MGVGAAEEGQQDSGSAIRQVGRRGASFYVFCCQKRFNQIMRAFLVFILMLSPAVLAAQVDLWKEVKPDAGPTRLARTPLTDAQRRAVFALFGAKGQTHVWECESAQDAKELQSGLSFAKIPVEVAKDQTGRCGWCVLTGLTRS